VSCVPLIHSPFSQETSPFTYVEINGLKIPEPSAAYSLLWEAVSGHDAKKDGHMRVSAKESLRNLVEWFNERSRGRGMGSEHAWSVVRSFD
jgi:origin recognition complex subunit 1